MYVCMYVLLLLLLYHLLLLSADPILAEVNATEQARFTFLHYTDVLACVRVSACIVREK